VSGALAPRILIVETDRARTRLDQFLVAETALEYSRSQVARLIKAGRVTLNGSPARPSSLVRGGDRVEISSPLAPAVPVAPACAPDIEVLFADAEIIVVNKPAGMAVHHSVGHSHSTLVDALLARFPELAAMVEPDALMRPGVVHRLDKDTSGLMVIARTPFARTALSRQFKERSVEKIYLAIVRGTIARDELKIMRAIGRHPTERKRMSVHSRAPREALSHVRVLYRLTSLPIRTTVVIVRPETGRTHQIRVHLSSIGHPCLGDPLYGGATGKDEPFFSSRQALHALALRLDHPRTGERLEYIAPLPDDLIAFFEKAKLGEAAVRKLAIAD